MISNTFCQLRIADHGPPDRRKAGSGGGDGQQSPEPPRRHGVHYGLLSQQRDRAFQRQLDVAGEGAYHANRRQGQDAGVERPRP